MSRVSKHVSKIINLSIQVEKAFTRAFPEISLSNSSKVILIQNYLIDNYIKGLDKVVIDDMFLDRFRDYVLSQDLVDEVVP